MHKRHKLKRSTRPRTGRKRNMGAAAATVEERKGRHRRKKFEDQAKVVMEEGWANLELEAVQLGGG